MSTNTNLQKNKVQETEKNFHFPDLATGLEDLTNLKPKDLSKHFEKLISLIPSGFAKKDPDYPAHKIMINGTRFSTFVVFSDGQKVLIFDRAGGFNSTEVVNHGFYDVFGAVTYENKSMFDCDDPKGNKIKSTDFAEVNIQKVESIPSMAIEINKNVINNTLETVVMYGLYVEVTSEDLKLALLDDDNEQLMIIDADNPPIYISKNLTSKAEHAIEYIQNRSRTSKR